MAWRFCCFSPYLLQTIQFLNRHQKLADLARVGSDDTNVFGLHCISARQQLLHHLRHDQCFLSVLVGSPCCAIGAGSLLCTSTVKEDNRLSSIWPWKPYKEEQEALQASARTRTVKETTGCPGSGQEDPAKKKNLYKLLPDSGFAGADMSQRALPILVMIQTTRCMQSVIDPQCNPAKSCFISSIMPCMLCMLC